MADNATAKDPPGVVILPCSGLDKEAGSASRELALMLSERGAPIVCPVLYERSPKRYEKALGAGRLVVIDGCKTGCASKLAAERGWKIARKLTVTEAAKQQGVEAGKHPRLGSALRDLLPELVEEILATGLVKAEGAEGATFQE